MITDVTSASLYQGYAYSYPHKTAYRKFEEPLSLEEVWAKEAVDALFLYIHIPFCGMRCGFCNLFTQAGAGEELVIRYLERLRRQAVRVRKAIGEAKFVRVAIGGGTPTYLNCSGLNSVLDVAEQIMGAEINQIPVSVEVSPETVTAEKMSLLAERGVNRISIGIQSFIDREVQMIGRPQHSATVEKALASIREARVATLNIDLIYGLPEQTLESWVHSVKRSLEYQPEELYLYPLYVRPLTGMSRSRREWDDCRVTFYREARALLLSAGYRQLSMRMFRSGSAPADSGPTYHCQEDDMVGLGCGARSYTGELHYCTEFAVGTAGVREILANYLDCPDEGFGQVQYGFRLNGEDQRRRYVIQSLLSEDGLCLPSYSQRFETDVRDDVPILAELESLGWTITEGDQISLTETGLERSDAIGPLLYSKHVQSLMETFSLR